MVSPPCRNVSQLHSSSLEELCADECRRVRFQCKDSGWTRAFLEVTLVRLEASPLLLHSLIRFHSDFEALSAFHRLSELLVEVDL